MSGCSYLIWVVQSSLTPAGDLLDECKTLLCGRFGGSTVRKTFDDESEWLLYTHPRITIGRHTLFNALGDLGIWIECIRGSSDATIDELHHYYTVREKWNVSSADKLDDQTSIIETSSKNDVIEYKRRRQSP